MNVVPAAVRPEPAQHFVFYRAEWNAYDKLLEIVGNRRIPITFDRGKMEIISPLPLHEAYKFLFGRLFLVFAMEFDIRMWAMGSTTLRRAEAEAGLEPDQCYYFANGKKVRDFCLLDLTVDPPPDLAIEIENTLSSLDRLQVYARLCIPEVWRFDGKTLEVHRLRSDGFYEVLPRSVELPSVPLEEVPDLLRRSLEIHDDRAQILGMSEWVRTRVAPLKQAVRPHTRNEI
jgi:Uma2 family endonuclease